MKRLILPIICCVVLLFQFNALAHSGRTDANGGHYDRETGEYHYHNGGSSKHDYTDNGNSYYNSPNYKTDYDYSRFSSSSPQEQIERNDNNVDNTSSNNKKTKSDKLTFGKILITIIKIIGSSIMISLGSLYLSYIAFGIIRIVVEAVFDISDKETIWNRIWRALVIICIISAISISIICATK